MSLFRSATPPRRVSPITGGLIGSIAHYVIARKVVGRVARVGGLQGMLLGAAATWALNKFFDGRRT